MRRNFDPPKHGTQSSSVRDVYCVDLSTRRQCSQSINDARLHSKKMACCFPIRASGSRPLISPYQRKFTDDSLSAAQVATVEALHCWILQLGPYAPAEIFSRAPDHLHVGWKHIPGAIQQCVFNNLRDRPVATSIDILSSTIWLSRHLPEAQLLHVNHACGSMVALVLSSEWCKGLSVSVSYCMLLSQSDGVMCAMYGGILFEAMPSLFST